mgnify:CR=1 FL=1
MQPAAQFGLLIDRHELRRYWLQERAAPIIALQRAPIPAAKAGASCVVAAEIDPLALAAIDLNSRANNVFVEPIGIDVIGSNPRWNTVLAGDMCYERPVAERLVPWLRHLVKSGVRVLLGDPGRNYFPSDGIVKLATFAVPTTLDLEDREVRETSVYQLTE